MPQKLLEQQPIPKMYQNSHVFFVNVKMSSEFSPQTSIKYNGNCLLFKISNPQPSIRTGSGPELEGGGQQGLEKDGILRTRGNKIDTTHLLAKHMSINCGLE